MQPHIQKCNFFVSPRHITSNKENCSVGPTLTLSSRNSAPNDSTCSLTAALVSNPRTMAPMFLAVPMADSPATPPPITSTLAGGTLPAAVIWPGRETLIKKEKHIYIIHANNSY